MDNCIKRAKYKYKYKCLKLKLKGGAKQEIQLENKTQEFVNSLKGAKPINELSPKDARDVLNNLQKGDVNVPTEHVDITLQFKGNPFDVRIIRPNNTKEKLPIVVYYHGGGWILGNRMTHDRLVRELSYGAQVGIVFVEYTPSPEAQFTTILEQCYQGLTYIKENADKYNLDASKIAVAGDSVGGNLTIAITLLAKNRNGPKIQRQALFYPVTDAKMNTESYETFKDGPWLTKPAMEWFWDAYAPNVSDRTNILLSPVNATSDQLKDLPPALLIVDENDVLRDEGEMYAHNLMKAGVDVRAMRMLGTVHDFMMLRPLADTPATREAVDAAINFLHKLNM